MIVAMLSLVTGCAVERFQDRQKELCDPEYGCAERPWWPDQDGDGWGDPGGAAEWSRDALEGRANNALDCDDGDAAVTANVGGLCPREFGAVESVAGGVDEADFGNGIEPAEWVVVILAPGVRVHEAEDLCELGWGGWDADGEPVGRLGAPEAPLTDLDDVWISGADGEAHPSWADDSPEGASIWTGTEVVTAEPADTAAPSCIRPLPDPADWATYEEPR